MTLLLILSDNATLYSLSLIFVAEAKQYEAKASATVGDFFAHDNSIFDFTELLEVVEQVRL